MQLPFPIRFHARRASSSRTHHGKKCQPSQHNQILYDSNQTYRRNKFHLITTCLVRAIKITKSSSVPSHVSHVTFLLWTNPCHAHSPFMLGKSNRLIWYTHACITWSNKKILALFGFPTLGRGNWGNNTGIRRCSRYITDFSWIHRTTPVSSEVL